MLSPFWRSSRYAKGSEKICGNGAYFTLLNSTFSQSYLALGSFLLLSLVNVLIALMFLGVLMEPNPCILQMVKLRPREGK